MSIFSTDTLNEVNRLTRSGDAAAATALIQSVLMRTPVFDATHGASQAARSGRHPAAGRPVRVINPEVGTPSGGVAGSGAADRDGPAGVFRSARSAAPGTAAWSSDHPAGTAGTSVGTVTQGRYAHPERQLDYRLFIPERQSQAPAPLLLMLHGCTQDAEDFALGTAMNAVAQQAGMYVLYPNQAASANMNRCWNWFEPAHQQRGAGEPALLSGLTRQIVAEYPIDAERVFVAGLSAGGAMALILAEHYPDLYAAVGVHSGLPTGVATSLPEALTAMRSPVGSSIAGPGRHHISGGPLAASRFRDFSPVNGESARAAHEHGSPLPTIVFHGTRDRTVNPANAERIVSDWLSRNQGGGASAGGWQQQTDRHTAADGQVTTVIRYTDGTATQRSGCEYWQTGSAHCWSGGNPAGSFTDAGGPDASEEMVRFFLSGTARQPGPAHAERRSSDG